MRLRETKPLYFWCQLAEGRIKIFHVVRLRVTKQIPILRSAAEGSAAQTILVGEAEGSETYICKLAEGRIETFCVVRTRQRQQNRYGLDS